MRFVWAVVALVLATVMIGAGIAQRTIFQGPRSTTADVSITQDEPYLVIDGAVLEGDNNVGPFARLRPGTELARGARIGNFVETKNAQVGVDAKINHLSYVGDATLGEAVNVGAGTITCNYDGANKFRTEIGANAFIGSNSALVAPLKIGAGATVGAGSTLSRDVAEGALSVARGKRIDKPEWPRPTKK